MHFAPEKLIALASLAALSLPAAPAPDRLAITIPVPPPPQSDGFKMGAARRPDGATLTLDSRSLLLDGKPWLPVMGEFHFSRYPENDWREELLKMKAGGISIVATYVFWIHHEEIEGQFDWSGRRSLRHFIEQCRDAGLKAVVRCGPWCHGEVRNGGLPDWILQKGWKTRSDDTNYLDKVRNLYGEISKQLDGLLWKDGGPVIGIQLENEFGGPSDHLLTLKRLAREAGLDVPLYTRTGWPELRKPLPFGEIVPLFGAYAEGFWDRALTPMPGRYWSAFQFSKLRTDSAIATDQLGNRKAQDASDVAQYPYLTCEIGGGMMNSYHRRIVIDPADVESTVLVKVGSGSDLPGYYMFHGGENPEGKLSTLQESQATGYWNDLPVKSYDFRAPLGQYGQLRPQYHLLRRLHLFLADFGSTLATMPTTLPDLRPAGRDDTATLRWAVRSDGVSGVVFVNNYQRLQPMPPKTNVQFALKLPSGTLTFPTEPIALPANSRFFWPFNFDLRQTAGAGSPLRLAYATAQPICAVDDKDLRTLFFAETPGVKAQFAFDAAPGLKVQALSGKLVQNETRLLVRNARPGTGPALKVSAAGGSTVQIVLLDEAASLALWKASWKGRDRVFITKAGIALDGDTLRLTATNPADLAVGVFPSPETVLSGAKQLKPKADGVFRRFTPPRRAGVSPTVVPSQNARPTTHLAFEQVKAAGPARAIPLGKIKSPVAAAPEDADFSEAAIWRIKLPTSLDLSSDPILRLHYVGDVARVILNGKMLTDDFYNGLPLDVGLRRYVDGQNLRQADLRVAILPLRKDAPIYLPKRSLPDFGKAESVVALKEIGIVSHYRAELQAR